MHKRAVARKATQDVFSSERFQPDMIIPTMQPAMSNVHQDLHEASEGINEVYGALLPLSDLSCVAYV